MFTLTFYLLLLLASIKRLNPEVRPPERQNCIDSASAVVTSCSRRNFQLLNTANDLPPRAMNSTIFAVALLLSGDIQVNPGPPTSVYPCGVCEDPVTWNCRGVACDHCSIWYHGSCRVMWGEMSMWTD